MQILETKSEVKVTVTPKRNGALLDHKAHSHTEFGVSYLKLYKGYAPDMIILKTRSGQV